MEINEVNNKLENLLNEDIIKLLTEYGEHITVKVVNNKNNDKYSYLCNLISPPNKIRMGVRMLGMHNNDVYGYATLNKNIYEWKHPKSGNIYSLKLTDCKKNHNELRLLPTKAKTWDNINSKDISHFGFIDLKRER